MAEKKTKTGRRKTSVAQVRINSGKGDVTVNTLSIDEYFRGIGRYRNVVMSPIFLVEDAKKYDYIAKVNGGGISSQAGAIRHAIARTIAGFSDESKKIMKKAGYLTRDPRMVERKKPGQPKARKRFQYSKR
jgi:small subunit ribosomal protein S9